MKTRGKYLQFIVSMAIIAVAAFGVLNRQWITDQITVWQFQPSQQVAAIASKAKFSEKGKFYLYASKAQLSDRAEFNSECKHQESGTVVLGCYAAWQIFIYDITDKRLDGIKEVTAAHEMLHAAFDRLGESERERITALLRAEAVKIGSADFKKRLAVYKDVTQADRDNELHSIIATEVQTISPELETYYQQYFTDRSAVVKLFKKYEATIIGLHDTQARLVTELDTLADQINAKVAQYNADSKVLSSDVAAFNARAEAPNGFATNAEFTAQRNNLLERQQALTSRYDELGAMTATYNTKKQQLEALNLQADSLQRSLDSTLRPVPAV